MASGADVIPTVSEVESAVEALSVSENLENGGEDTVNEEQSTITPLENGVEVRWGFSQQELYRIALKFYKGNLVIT